MADKPGSTEPTTSDVSTLMAIVDENGLISEIQIGVIVRCTDGSLRYIPAPNSCFTVLTDYSAGVQTELPNWLSEALTKFKAAEGF